MQEIVQLLQEEIAYEILHGGSALEDHLRTQFGLGLGFEYGFLYTDGNGGHDRLPDVRRVVVLLEELTNGLYETFPEGRHVCTALGGVLSVDETVQVFAVFIIVRYGDLDVLPFQVNDRVSDLILIGLARQQVQQTVLAHELLAIVVDGQTCVQVAIIPDLIFEIIRDEMVVAEHGLVRLEEYHGPIRLFGRNFLVLFHQHTFIELGGLLLSITVRGDLEIGRQCIDRLGTHPVQAHAFLENPRIILGARVDLAHHIDHFAQGNAPAIVAHLHARAFDGDLDLLAVTHHVLVDAVVQHLLHQDVDAVVEGRAIAQLADVHARPQPDVLLPVQ